MRIRFYYWRAQLAYNMALHHNKKVKKVVKEIRGILKRLDSGIWNRRQSVKEFIEDLKVAIMAESYEDRAGRSVISVKSALDIVDRLAAEQEEECRE